MCKTLLEIDRKTLGRTGASEQGRREQRQEERPGVPETRGVLITTGFLFDLGPDGSDSPRES